MEKKNSFLKNYSNSLIFLSILVTTLLIEPYLTLTTKQVAYGISLLIKDILVFCLPFVIFCLINNSIAKLGSQALKYIALIIPLVCVSNFINTMLSFGLSGAVVKFGILGKLSLSNVDTGLQPAFELHLPQLVSNNFALFFGMLSGLIFGIGHIKNTERICAIFSKFTNYFFKVLIPIMPIFIAGTALKLQYDGTLKAICTNYAPVLLTFIITAYGYVLLQFCLLAKFNFSAVGNYIRNLIPAIVTAFGSMSSIAALPLAIKASVQNVKNPENANIILPSVINIHLVGDCFFIPLLAITVMTSFGMDFPSLAMYLPFAIHFMLAKFSVAAVPGGGVLVMFPVMQTYLGMSSDMLAIVTALYLLFDPIITVCNVSGNGAIAIIFDRLTGICRKKYNS